MQYDLSFKYLAIMKGDQYVAFPTDQEVMGCQLTAGAFCELNTAMFPTLNLVSCEFALYKKAHEQVIKTCKVKTSPLIRDQAVSLEPNYWVVITQKPRILHINCLQMTTYLQVKYPTDIIHLQDGCEAVSATLVLPGHSRLVKENDFLVKSHSVKFKLQYTEIQDFNLVKQIIPTRLSPEQLKAIGNNIQEPQVSSITKLQGQLKHINTNYPYSMPLYLKMILTCISTILLIAGLLLGFKCYKHGCSMTELVPLFAKHKPNSNEGTLDCPQYISEQYRSAWRQSYQPRSSVVIQEMEMQPMLRQTTTRTTTSRLTPAIEAPDQVSEAPILQETVPATPESVAKALEHSVGLNFEKYYKKKKNRRTGQQHNLQ